MTARIWRDTLGVVATTIGLACSRGSSNQIRADGTIELTEVDIAPFVSGRVVSATSTMTGASFMTVPPARPGARGGRAGPRRPAHRRAGSVHR